MILDARTSTEETRARLLIGGIIRHLALNLDGLSVLTEMGGSHYVYTPLIAALAGAKRVVAVVKDSPCGSRQDVVDRGARLANSWGMRCSIDVVFSLSPALIAQADIVTNLGFVRPIDAAFISHMKPGAVIPYMREAWEYRPGDVDLAACRAKNIPVMGTFENYDGLGIFDLCGPLATKMLFEAGLEVKGNRIIVASEDSFGDVICAYLRICGADVQHVRRAGQLDLQQIDQIDALLVACYATDQVIIGTHGWFDPSKLAAYHPECTVIQFAGNVDTKTLSRYRVHCIPETPAGQYRMAQTLAALGPKPVIDLHGAGLRVGELMWRKMRLLQNAKEVEQTLAKEHRLCQCLLVT